MRKNFLLPLLIIGAAILLAYALLGLRQRPEQSPPGETVLLVETLALQPTTATLTVQSQGTVEARTRSSLVAEVGGRIVAVAPSFVAGGFFRSGDLLLQLDDANYRAALSRAEAALATARSALELERAQADVAQREWDRMSPEQQARISGRELYLRKPQQAEAQARLAAAEADLEEARRNLAKTRITAPYDGLVSSKASDIGQFVNAGSVLAETFAVDYAEVRLPLPETRLALLELPAPTSNDSHAGPEVELHSQLGERSYRWQGRLVRTEGVLDTRTRTLHAVVRVEDPYGLYGKRHDEPLRIGTYVTASIAGRTLQDVLVLPRHTLQAGNLVWVADREQRLRARQVEVAAINGDAVHVRSGLQAGDQVVLTRMENPLNGMAVQSNTHSSLNH